MWRRLQQTLVSLVLVKLYLVLVAHALPLFDAGPHVHNGWGESIRIRRLYTARKHGQDSYYLSVHKDGRVDGERYPSSHSLLEIRAVAVGSVAIKGYQSSLYLCMEREGKLHGMHSYSPEDCSFEEEMLPDGYNMYKSKKYGVAVSLCKDKQRQQYKGKGYLPFSHFIPVMSWVPLDPPSAPDELDYSRIQSPIDKMSDPFIDSMDPLGLVDRPTYHTK
ncbi:hypothetical protein FKM82_003416 [Ascaphus truei]